MKLTSSPITSNDLGVLLNYINEELDGYTNLGILYDIENMNWEHSIKLEDEKGTILGFATIDKDYLGLFFVAPHLRGRFSSVFRKLCMFLGKHASSYSYDTLMPEMKLPSRFKNSKYISSEIVSKRMMYGE